MQLSPPHSSLSTLLQARVSETLTISPDPHGVLEYLYPKRRYKPQRYNHAFVPTYVAARSMLCRIQ